jgi:hypothetical protein
MSDDVEQKINQHQEVTGSVEKTQPNANFPFCFLTQTLKLLERLRSKFHADRGPNHEQLLQIAKENLKVETNKFCCCYSCLSLLNGEKCKICMRICRVWRRKRSEDAYARSFCFATPLRNRSTKVVFACCCCCCCIFVFSCVDSQRCMFSFSISNEQIPMASCYRLFCCDNRSCNIIILNIKIDLFLFWQHENKIIHYAFKIGADLSETGGQGALLTLKTTVSFSRPT